MSYLFAICDEQESYVCKLAGYLNLKKGFPFQVRAFDNVNKLIEYHSHTGIELLLISEKLFFSNEDKLDVPNIILLNESGIEPKNGYRFVYKYQSAENIYRSVLNIYGEIGDPTRLAFANKKVTVIGIYSPIKRCLQTSFALTLGQILAKRKRCLYLNFEPFSGLSSLMNRQFEQDFMDLLYFLNGGIEKFIYKLKSMVETIGELDYIPPALSFMDLAEVEKDSFRILLEEIALRTDYEIVILDLSENVRSLFDILLSCDKIYTITRSDGVALAKFHQYEQLLQFMRKEEIMDRTKKVELPVFKEIPAKVELLPLSQLADYIRKMLAEEGEEYV